MTRLLIGFATALLLTPNVFAQDRLFLANAGEVGTANRFGEIIGPSPAAAWQPRIGGNRYAVTPDDVVDLRTGVHVPLPAGAIVAYNRARPRVFVAREDGVWSVDVLSGVQVRVLTHQVDGPLACR